MADSVAPRIETFEGACGVPIVADVYGDARRPTVIFGHGGGQTRHSWKTATAALAAAGYHVINYDARGHGDSGWAGRGGYNNELRARDLMAIVGDRPEPVAFVGASMGGATALYTAATRPELKVGALVLVDIVPHPDPAGIHHINAFMNAHTGGFDTLEQVADAIAAYNPARPRPDDLSGLSKNVRLREGRYYWHWDPAFMAKDNTGEMNVLADVVEHPKRPLDFPVMLVRGLKSDIVSESGVASLQKLIPHVEIRDIAGAGHMVAGDRNDAFNGATIAFLKAHFPPA